MAQMCGGTGSVKAATPDIQDICAKVKGEAEAKISRFFSEFTAKTFKTQVVAGTNYFIKVHVGNNEHLHLRVFKSLQGEINLHSLQEGKAEDDELAYF